MPRSPAAHVPGEAVQRDELDAGITHRPLESVHLRVPGTAEPNGHQASTAVNPAARAAAGRASQRQLGEQDGDIRVDRTPTQRAGGMVSSFVNRSARTPACSGACHGRRRPGT